MKMNILAILGSPHPNGNTATFLQKVLEGATAQGAITTTISVNNLAIRACQACDACKRTGQCILKDDMQEIYDKINKSDVVIFASPNYMGGIAGNIKPVIDRLYPYISVTETGELKTTMASPKKVLLLITQNAPEDTHYIEAFTPLKGILGLIFQGSVSRPAQWLIAPNMKGPMSVATNVQLIQKAYATGVELVPVPC